MESATAHTGQPGLMGMATMREVYDSLRIIPTSTNADTVLIRSHIAYWLGNRVADRAAIKPSRGHSYRVNLYGSHDRNDTIVRITDYFDHREGVTGLR